MAEKVKTEWRRMFPWGALFCALVLVQYFVPWIVRFILSFLLMDAAELVRNITQWLRSVAALLPPVPGWLDVVWMVLVSACATAMTWRFWQREQAKH